MYFFCVFLPPSFWPNSLIFAFFIPFYPSFSLAPAPFFPFPFFSQICRPNRCEGIQRDEDNPPSPSLPTRGDRKGIDLSHLRGVFKEGRRGPPKLTPPILFAPPPFSFRSRPPTSFGLWIGGCKIVGQSFLSTIFLFCRRRRIWGGFLIKKRKKERDWRKTKEKKCAEFLTLQTK